MKETWARFTAEVEVRTGQLLADLEAAWSDTEAAAGLVESAVENRWADPEPGQLEAARGFLQRQGSALLDEPLGLLQRKRPLMKSLSAYETWSSGLAEAARSIRPRISASRQECAEAVGIDLPLWSRIGASKRHDIEVREAVLAEVAELELARSRLDGEWQLLLANCSMRMPSAWQAVRQNGLAAAAGLRTEAPLDDELEHIRGRRARWRDLAVSLLAEYRMWRVEAVRRLNRCLLEVRANTGTARERRQLKRAKHFAYWSRQARAVQALLDLHLQFWQMGLEAVEETSRALESLSHEHTDLTGEMDQVLGWLRSWERGEATGPFPSPQARLLSAEERTSEWVRTMEALAMKRLPMVVEALRPKRALPGWREPWRRVEPQRLMCAALRSVARDVVLSGLREAEAAHSAMVREIERAREVVAYGFEQAKERGAGAELAREAAANAIELLTYQRRQRPDPRPGAEPQVLMALALAFAETHSGLVRSHLGLLAHATRRRGLKAATELAALAVAAGRRGLGTAIAAGQSLVGLLLQKGGLVTPPVRRVEPVHERPVLGQALALTLGERDLPMLYRRLFRLAPVEDPRFLIGRELEMNGLADAAKRWQAGRPAQVLVIGARGSGKTSLLNCAIAGPLAGLSLRRAQFSARIRSCDELRRFVGGLIGVDNPNDVEEALRNTRQVLVLEELERVYLGEIGGYKPLYDLLNLIEATAGATLWVLSLNETAFRHLDAVTRIGSHFSHRINAMSVEQKQLEAAILYRHHLSGMRLQFAPLPQDDVRVRRVRRTLGLEKSPQEVFFDSLYEQSEGIFRSAFELWQDSIERIEGGMVHIRQPLAPDYRPLMAELDQEDQFLLRAALRHGSLTPSEAARVLLQEEDAARRQIRRLEALEILEADPNAPGYRVKPQAGRLVRELLFRMNLQ